jgi:hypothetical protein
MRRTFSWNDEAAAANEKAALASGADEGLEGERCARWWSAKIRQ